MLDLERTLRWMQTVIVHPEGVAEGISSPEAWRYIDVVPDQADQVLTRSRQLSAVERLGIYSSAYYGRLLECLREEFPVVKHALGEELFDEFAVGFLQRFPSRSYTLFQLGADFPRYLEETRPDSESSPDRTVGWPDFLIDLAALERQFNEVFDGPGVEGEVLLTPEQLHAVPANRFPEVRLTCVDCLRVLRLRYPVHSYFAAVRRKEEPVLPDPAETFLAVTRKQFVVHHYELTPASFQLLRALIDGRSVGEAIAAAAEAAGPDLDGLALKLGEWFHRWGEEGFFRSVRVPS